MTTTPAAPAAELEPAAWMYERPGVFVDVVRQIDEYRKPNWHVTPQGWTETPLYTADQLQALIEERDRLRNGLIRAESDLHLIALYPRLTYDNLREVCIARDNARAALAGEKP